MQTYFVRHNVGIDIDDRTRRRLWDERRVAIHFPWARGKDKTRDSRSLSPDAYEGAARRAMKILVELVKAGGYVCAEHHGHTECMLGFVPPGSRVELFNGTWGDRHSRESRVAVLKSVRLSKVKLIDPVDYAVLAVCRPRQGTIMRWH